MAEANQDARGQVNCRIGLGKIFIDQGDLASVNGLLEEALIRARENMDRRYIAQTQLERARLAVAHSDVVTAQEALVEAKELFGRLTLTADRERLQDTERRFQILIEQQSKGT